MSVFRFSGVLVPIMLTLVLVAPVHADNFTNVIEVFNQSESVQPFFENAYGYAVFPMVRKAGFGIGGAYGTGLVYRGGEVTGTTSLIKGTIGFQLGVQAFSEIIFFQDKRSYDEFTSGSFELDAAASAVAMTAGVQVISGTEGSSAGASSGPATGAQAQTNYRKGMAVFIHTQGGLMFEASIGGQRFSFRPI